MNIKKHISTIRTELKSARGKKLLQFLLFTFIAFIFWFALTLNEEFRYDVEYSLSLGFIAITSFALFIVLIRKIMHIVSANISAMGKASHTSSTLPESESKNAAGRRIPS